MAKLNLTEAAKAAGIGRTTLYNHIKQGKISCEVNEKDKKVIDVTELIRVYGELQKPETLPEHSDERQSEHGGTVETPEIVQVMQDRVRDLEERVEELKQDKRDLLTILKQQTLLLPAGTDEKSAGEDTEKRNTKKNSRKKGFWGKLFGGKK